MKKTGKFMIISAVCAAVVAAAGGHVAVRASEAAFSKDDNIAAGVYIGPVDVGGMNRTQAEAAVNEFVNDLGSTEFLLKGAAGNISMTGEEMGAVCDVSSAVDEAMGVARYGNLISRFKESKDLESTPQVIGLNITVDTQATAQKIYDYQSTLNIKEVDNSLTRENGEFTFVAGSSGEEVDIVSSVYAIEDYLSYDWQGGDDSIDLVVEEVEPRGSEEELSQIQDCLGSFHTDFSSSASGRAQNVKNGCSKINGTILYPGDSFSVYNTISPFTEENGYELAGSYENGTVVETLGGGICQVSTTLYNAVIRAELEVTMRYNHSMLVHYVEPSDDAAIAGGIKDFKFVNNLENPVYLEGYCEGGVIYFNVYGKEYRPSNRKVSFESETLETIEPETKYEYDNTLSLGTVNVTASSTKGCEARLWKIVTVDGVEESREIFNTSTYKAAPRTVTIGTKGATSDQIVSIRSAANSDDEEKVKSLANEYANDNAEAAYAAAVKEAEAKAAAEKAAAEKAAKTTSDSSTTKKTTTEKTTTEKTTTDTGTDSSTDGDTGSTDGDSTDGSGESQ